MATPIYELSVVVFCVLAAGLSDGNPDSNLKYLESSPFWEQVTNSWPEAQNPVNTGHWSSQPSKSLIC